MYTCRRVVESLLDVYRDWQGCHVRDTPFYSAKVIPL